MPTPVPVKPRLPALLTPTEGASLPGLPSHTVDAPLHPPLHPPLDAQAPVPAPPQAGTAPTRQPPAGKG